VKQILQCDKVPGHSFFHKVVGIEDISPKPCEDSEEEEEYDSDKDEEEV